MKKGQLTIEYLIILVVLLILFTSVSMDLMTFSTQNTLEIQTRETMKAHDQLLTQTASTLSLQSTGARKTLVLNAPSDCGYDISASQITLECQDGTPSENITGTNIGSISGATYDTDYNDHIDRGKTEKIRLER